MNFWELSEEEKAAHIILCDKGSISMWDVNEITRKLLNTLIKKGYARFDHDNAKWFPV